MSFGLVLCVDLLIGVICCVSVVIGSAKAIAVNTVVNNVMVTILSMVCIGCIFRLGRIGSTANVSI